MKKFLLYSLLFFIFYSQANSQGTASLVFSRVLLVSSVETVPVGYVWKIENILPNNRLSSAAVKVSKDQGSLQTETLSTTQLIKVNNNDIYIASSDSKSQGVVFNYDPYGLTSTSSASANSIIGSPIWLSENTSLEASTGVYAVSVLEFKVIPD